MKIQVQEEAKIQKWSSIMSYGVFEYYIYDMLSYADPIFKSSYFLNPEDF